MAEWRIRYGVSSPLGFHDAIKEQEPDMEGDVECPEPGNVLVVDNSPFQLNWKKQIMLIMSIIFALIFVTLIDIYSSNVNARVSRLSADLSFGESPNPDVTLRIESNFQLESKHQKYDITEIDCLMSYGDDGLTEFGSFHFQDDKLSPMSIDFRFTNYHILRGMTMDFVKQRVEDKTFKIYCYDVKLVFWVWKLVPLTLDVPFPITQLVSGSNFADFYTSSGDELSSGLNSESLTKSKYYFDQLYVEESSSEVSKCKLN